jgi:quinol monooxygenase YgiN
MALTDPCCTLVPYFKVHDDKLEEFRKLGERFVEKTQTEAECMHYGFSFNGQQAHCREGYANAEALLSHLENVGALLDQVLKIADITRLEVHAPATEIEKLREPLSELNPEFYTMETGFRR